MSTNTDDVRGPRLTVQDADDCVADMAQAYKNMDYLQLRDIANTTEGRLVITDRMWRGSPIRLTIQVHHFGRLRRRVSVEIVASAEGDDSWPWTPCIYFERYASGRLYHPPDRGILGLILYVLAMVFLYVMLFVGVVSAVGAGIWYVMHLRTWY